MIYQKQTKELKQEIEQLQSLISQAEHREMDVQQALRRAKCRNGQLLVEMQDLREQLETQRSSRQAEDLALKANIMELEQKLLAAEEQTGQGTGKESVPADLAEKMEETQRLLEDARDRATDAEMECDSLRKQLEEKSKSTALRNESGEGDEDDLAEKLEETQRLLEDARDRATDAEMECDSLRKQLEEEKSKGTFLRNKSGEGDEDDLAGKLEETRRLLEDARDRATDAEMECDSLRKQLEEEKPKGTSLRNKSGEGDEDDLAGKLEETRRLLEDARDRATDAEMECDSLRKQLEEEKSKGTSLRNKSGEGDEDDLAEKLEDAQRLLEDARDRVTDAEMECDSLRKQLEEKSKSTALRNESGEGEEDDLAERLEETQRLLEDARDRVTDAEMECDSLRKQLEEKSKSTGFRNESGEGDEDDLAEKLEETQRLLEDARDRATDAEMECDSLRKQLEEEKSKGTSLRNKSGEGDEDDLAGKLEETQRLLADATDQVANLEMERELLLETRKEEEPGMFANGRMHIHGAVLNVQTCSN